MRARAGRKTDRGSEHGGQMCIALFGWVCGAKAPALWEATFLIHLSDATGRAMDSGYLWPVLSGGAKAVALQARPGATVPDVVRWREMKPFQPQRHDELFGQPVRFCVCRLLLDRLGEFG